MTATSQNQTTHSNPMKKDTLKKPKKLKGKQPHKTLVFTSFALLFITRNKFRIRHKQKNVSTCSESSQESSVIQSACAEKLPAQLIKSGQNAQKRKQDTKECADLLFSFSYKECVSFLLSFCRCFSSSSVLDFISLHIASHRCRFR